MEKDSIALKKAIAIHDWATSVQLAKEILSRMDNKQNIDIAANLLMDYLPIFEKYHPEATWPRTFLNAVINSAHIDPEGSLPIYEEGYSSPGSINFLEALGRINSARLHVNDNLSLDLALGAIVATIGAFSYEYWANIYPDDWEIVRKPKTAETNFPQLRSRMLADPQVENYTERIWATLYERIIKLLNQRM
jgi:hypothetical protein